MPNESATRASRSTFTVPRRAIEELSAYLSGLEPECITTADATELFSLFAELARLGAAGQTLMAARAAKGDAWRRAGHRSAASWMARQSGTGLGEAVGLLETAERLEALPDTTDALRRGELSATQVKEISAAAVTRPSAEGELLALAAQASVKQLKDRCRAVRALRNSAASEAARYEAIHKTRYFRHWSDPDGALRGEFKLTPDAGARLVAAVETTAGVRFDEARRAGRHEPTRAYRADALVDLATGTAPRAGSGGSVMHFRVDATAIRRGHAEEGEICEIPGVGPVPVATVRALLPEAFVKVVIHDGVDVLSVSHHGRSLTAHQRTAIEERDPTCVVPGCDVAHGLEIDHYGVDYADHGPTALHNLARLCHFHHFQKTYRGFVLRGGPGRWDWDPPPDPDSG